MVPQIRSSMLGMAVVGVVLLLHSAAAFVPSPLYSVPTSAPRTLQYSLQRVLVPLRTR